MGSSAFSDNEIYEKLAPFIKLWHSLSDTSHNPDGSRMMRIPLYFVTVDVEKAYDNIVQSKLFQILERVIDCVCFR